MLQLSRLFQIYNFDNLMTNSEKFDDLNKKEMEQRKKLTHVLKLKQLVLQLNLL